MSQATRAVIFDCFGVLATDNWQVFQDSLPAEADTEKARQAHRDYDSGLISKASCDQLIKAATGQHFIEPEDSQVKAVKNQPLLDYIKQLHEQHYKISILSNVASNWLRQEFLSPSEQSLFDDFVLSYEVGMIKPDPQIFLLAAQRLGVKPTEAVLVDDKAVYCQAAQSLGLKAVWYRDLKQCQSDLKKILV